jgi:hypothetical protein
MNAVNPRMIAGGRDNSASAPADNYGFTGELWVISFFNRGVKSITVDMGNRQAFKLGMRYKAPPTAMQAIGGARMGCLAAISAHMLDSLNCIQVKILAEGKFKKALNDTI